MRPLRLSWLFFRIGALNDLQYRANFWLQLLQSAIQLGTGLAVLGLIFSQTPALNGWSQPALLAVMGVHILMGGVIGSLIQPSMERLRQDIREGTFDFVLTKPEDIQVLSSVREIRIWQAVDVLVGLVVLVIAIGQLQEGVGLLEALAFLVALVAGGLMIYAFWLVLTTVAFWIVRIDEIAELFAGLYQSGRWPVTIYPGWLRISLTFLVPIAFAVTVPAQALTRQLTPETLVLALGFAVVALVVSRAFFRIGLRRYSGASS
ncbi:MAG TPA: ABC-2 family transporter protein [Candidatus Limnocylindrales bacterium]|nr:ABC-2 family transporter protein [Candidatus Limnocylindrales bacterium]